MFLFSPVAGCADLVQKFACAAPRKAYSSSQAERIAACGLWSEPYPEVHRAGSNVGRQFIDRCRCSLFVTIALACHSLLDVTDVEEDNTVVSLAFLQMLGRTMFLESVL